MTDTAANPPRFQISGPEIDRVTRRFYARIRAHEVLGPIFAAHVTDWPTHEDKVCAFWRNVILHERGFTGSPMRAHLQARDVKPDHFPQWLGLFDEVLTELLAADQAAAWSAIAHRIGAAQRMGVAERDRPAGGPPRLV